MIDNIELIKPLLKFESKDDFYYLQILQRKKENPQLGSNSRVIKNYYIKSIEYLDDRYEEIKMLCNQFNARASLRLNKRSFEKVAFKTLSNITNTMMSRDYDFINKAYDRACGQSHNDKDKTWIIDIDKDDLDSNNVYNFISLIIDSRPNKGEDKIVAKIPSKTGIHLITNPFDVQEFKKRYSNIDIQKDNPTNLYIP